MNFKCICRSGDGSFFSWYEDGLVNKDGVVRKKAGKYFFASPCVVCEADRVKNEKKCQFFKFLHILCKVYILLNLLQLLIIKTQSLMIAPSYIFFFSNYIN